MTKQKTMTKQRGFTMLETFVILFLLGVLLVFSVPNINSFLTRMEVVKTLRTITGAFNSARFLSIAMNKRVKITLTDRRIHLQESKSGKWVVFKSILLTGEVSVSMNASPVFSAQGDVAPLCTVTVWFGQFFYKITISMAGRLLVTPG